MKGFLQEYGIIMVVVAVVLGMLGFSKTTYAKEIQRSIVGSINHITETGGNITKKEKVTVNDTLDIEGTKYVVLEEREENQVLVITASSIGNKVFHSNLASGSTLRPDGQRANTYEGSEIDNYLENEWYNSLSSTMKAAIQSTNIKQASYTTDTNPDSKYDNPEYNVISRHAFLPSVSEIGKIVDLKSPNKVKLFLNRTNIWTRDSDSGNHQYAEYLNAYVGKLNHSYVKDSYYGIRPAFVIDLSKVDYSVVSHTDYK